MPWKKPYHPSRNQRLPETLYADPDQVCFITLRAYAGQRPFVTPELNARIVKTLFDAQDAFGCLVYAYCLMPDHLHYLVRPRDPGSSVVTFTDRFKGKSTNQSWSAGWTGHLWQPRFYDHFVRGEESLAAIARYILENPVRRGLVARVEDWPWGGEATPLPL